MLTTESPTAPAVFASEEIITLCRSIESIHRSLTALGKFLNDMEELYVENSISIKGDFQKYGIRQIAEGFLEEQEKQLSRIIQIYRDERILLLSRTKV